MPKLKSSVRRRVHLPERWTTAWRMCVMKNSCGCCTYYCWLINGRKILCLHRPTLPTGCGVCTVRGACVFWWCPGRFSLGLFFHFFYFRWRLAISLVFFLPAFSTHYALRPPTPRDTHSSFCLICVFLFFCFLFGVKGHNRIAVRVYYAIRAWKWTNLFR